MTEVEKYIDILKSFVKSRVSGDLRLLMLRLMEDAKAEFNKVKEEEK